MAHTTTSTGRQPPSAQNTVSLRLVDQQSGEQKALYGARIEKRNGRLFELKLDDAQAITEIENAGHEAVVEILWRDGDIEAVYPVQVKKTDPNSGRLVAEGIERRTHLRVRSSIIFKWRKLSEAEAAEMAPRIMTQPLEYLGEDQALERTARADETWERLDIVMSNFYRMLRDISEQVQYLIALQEGRAQIAPPERTGCIFNISGAGFAFESREPLPLGSPLKITFELSRFPYREIVCLGRVVRVECSSADSATGAPDYLVFVSFTHIREEDRDQIIRCVFRMRRRELRSRRNNTPSLGPVQPHAALRKD